tara:strand:- start:3732 stop:4232 length:501 start_codon:yes stop_codon:yes gene_type:complete
MTKEEIISKGIFIEDRFNVNYSEFKIELYLDFFRTNNEILFSNLTSLDSEPQMTVLTEIVNELISFDKKNEEWIKDKSWEHFKICVENTSYGMVDDDGFENEKEANIAHFKIYNKEDSYNALKLKLIMVDLDFTEFRYINLIFKCPWDEEHGIWIGVKNGILESVN